MSIVQGLACGKPTCPCARTTSTQNGVTHCPCTSHGKLQGDKNPSLSISVVNGKPLWHCKAACTQGEVANALRERGLWPDDETRSERRRHQKANEKRREWEAKYAETLKYAATKIRIDKPSGDKSVFWKPSGVATADLALYRYQDAIHRQESVVVICEGEPAADALATVEDALGITAVGTVCGAGVTPCDAALSMLIGRKVILWPDNDQPGARHMQCIAARLYALGGRDIRILDWADSPDKSDAADAVSTNVDIGALVSAAKPWEPTSFDLADLLERTVSAIRKFIVLDEHQLDTLALYVAHSHAIGAAEITAYINVSSAEKGSGKTRLLEVLRTLVANPFDSAHVTASVLVRKIDKDIKEKGQHTLLLDEVDALFRGNKEKGEHIRGILNSGYSRSGVYSMSEPVGNTWEPKGYHVFCPKIFAGIGDRLPDTVRDRSILITMHRSAPNEHHERFSLRKSPKELKPLHDEFKDWAIEAVPILMDSEPPLPTELFDRAADIWEPQLAVADLAGGGWPERARAAALALSAGVNVEDTSLGVMLLKDIKSILDSTGKDRIFTADLLTALCAMEESPWGDLRGKAIDGRRLATELKPYGIKTSTLRDLDTGKVAKGYYRTNFVDAWNRYLPADDIRVTAVTSVTDDVAEIQVVTPVTLVTAIGGADEEDAWLDSV